jgi:hypothetical protein
VQPNPSLKVSPNGVTHWACGAGASPQFCAAGPARHTVGPTLARTLGRRTFAALVIHLQKMRNRPTLILNAATLAAVALLASGCANSPTSLGRVVPRTNIVATYSASPNYETVDKYSFTQAEVLYPASQGHHRISVGDYLLAEVFELLGTRPVKSLRLLEFTARCNPSGLFMPRVIRDVGYKIELLAQNKTLIVGSLKGLDIGNQVVKQDQFFLVPVSVGDQFFQNQIAPVLGAAVADMRAKLSAQEAR